MTSIIKADTFQESDEKLDHDYFVKGTVEVTLRNETKTVPAIKGTNDGSITAYGMTGRYVTGTKAWPANVTQRKTPEGKIWDSVTFGRDDRSGKFNKTNALSFA